MYDPSKTYNTQGKLLKDNSVFPFENKNVNFVPYGAKLAQGNRIGLSGFSCYVYYVKHYIFKHRKYRLSDRACGLIAS